jgi:hypothetical protein
VTRWYVNAPVPEVATIRERFVLCFALVRNRYVIPISLWAVTTVLYSTYRLNHLPHHIQMHNRSQGESEPIES